MVLERKNDNNINSEEFFEMKALLQSLEEEILNEITKDKTQLKF